ncbi:hypothetical protein AB1Y20_007737 [Prymnesium parvum]|uniref:PDZ domain-containing protein n=1 Tax=Prymnesium parvum TaxID=97485 RepID=A0AB34IW33_PRYPA
MSSAASPRLAAPAASLAAFGLQRRVVEVEKSAGRALGCVLHQLGDAVFVDSCHEEAARCALPVGSILLRVNREAAPRDLKKTSVRITESSRLRLELLTHAQAREVRVGGGAEARGLSLAPAGPYARVLRVDEHSEAHRAGIQPGDLVLAMNGAMLPSVRAAHRVLRTPHELTLRIFSGDLLNMGADWAAFMRTVAHLQAVELPRSPVAS